MKKLNKTLKAYFYVAVLIAIAWTPLSAEAVTSSNPGFKLAPNGITVVCTGMPDGTIGEFNGQTYQVVYSGRDAAALEVAYWNKHGDLDRYLDTPHACTSNVKVLNYAFQNQWAFNGDIRSWDTHNVVSFISTFEGALNFNQNISSWNTVAGKYFKKMFYKASSFNQNVSKWNMSASINIELMFAFASHFNVNLNKWCVATLKSSWYYNNYDYSTPAWTLPRPKFGKKCALTPEEKEKKIEAEKQAAIEAARKTNFSYVRTINER
ncbi:BspA family leucine-rich repeat surface protein [Marinomonas sp. TI.3.20]|uniref:BspA family leucine-rich repeat surface protein n=1 Tax=Marinomonas sp. TI.3.20 TaxID=3121296 RepID=UPI00311F4FD8